MTSHLSAAEIQDARLRFAADQDDALYVEFTEAMARIGPRRVWLRRRRRFLRSRGYPTSGDGDLSGPLRT